MFTEFASQVWTASDVAVTISDNTDYSIDGSSKKLVWSTALNETVTLSFTSVDLSDYEEISLYIHQTALIATGNIFTITIGGVVYSFTKFDRQGWNHILIDCSDMTTITSIVFESLVSSLVLFVDYIGYRKVNADADLDLIEAFQSKISLDYDVETTLTASAPIGSTDIAFASNAYINDTSVILLDDGAGTTEEVALLAKSGRLRTALSNAFSIGDSASVLCPVLLEGYNEVEADPICGIMIYDKNTDSRIVEIPTHDYMKQKKFMGEVGILVYIDCSSKLKLLQLVRRYDSCYGERFQILLDGEIIDIILENSVFSDDLIGNNPRMAYYYMVEAQPGMYKKGQPITSYTISGGPTVS